MFGAELSTSAPLWGINSSHRMMRLAQAITVLWIYGKKRKEKKETNKQDYSKIVFEL